MKDSECQVGAKVICQVIGIYFSQIGRIIEVVHNHGRIDYYRIEHSNGCILIWYDVNSWNIYQPPANQAKFATNQTMNYNSIECPCGINRVDCTYHR